MARDTHSDQKLSKSVKIDRARTILMFGEPKIGPILVEIWSKSVQILIF